MTTSAPTGPKRRLWLTATSVTGGAVLTKAAVPFVSSIAPSERARELGALIEVELPILAAAELQKRANAQQPHTAAHQFATGSRLLVCVSLMAGAIERKSCTMKSYRFKVFGMSGDKRARRFRKVERGRVQ